jgi:hypothetical protein
MSKETKNPQNKNVMGINFMLVGKIIVQQIQLKVHHLFLSL